MRTTKFRDILWGVAYKLGLDPVGENFLSNQATTIGVYIDQWVRRLYDIHDWPEWTIIREFNPDPVTHIVSYEQLQTTSPDTEFRTHRIFKVYLVDPKTVSAPIDTKFKLRDDGIHCGFEHGSSVWIKYTQPPPRFTADIWRNNQAYAKDDVVYSYQTGECYKSKIYNNLAHDPIIGPRPVPYLQVATLQEYQASLGIPGQTKIMLVDLAHGELGENVPDPPYNSNFRLPVWDTNLNILVNALHTTVVSDTLVTVVTDISNQLIAALTGLGFTITADTTALTITLEADQNFKLLGSGLDDFPYYTTGPPGPSVSHPLHVVQVQAFIPGVPGTGIIPQLSKVTISQGQVIPNAIYTISFFDQSGARHTASYQSDNLVNGARIMAGLADAIAAQQASDPFFAALVLTVDSTEPSLTVASLQPTSIDVVIGIQSSLYWELVPFPLALADQVIRGAYADLLKEWTQAAQGMAEEQIVPTETATSSHDFESQPNTKLTSQQIAYSRYKITPP
jgi:hypothetical protein